MAAKSLTLSRLKSLLKKSFAGKLTAGNHCEDGQACVRELRACALALPWNDHPDGAESSPTDRACQILNDAPWSSDEARTEACLPLALLTEANAAPKWVSRYAERTIREIVPLAMRAAANTLAESGLAGQAESLEAAARRCEAEGTGDAARAAWDAAGAAGAARAAARAAGDAARAAGDAAWAAARTAGDAARDDVLRRGVAILIACHKGE